ncbi:hypothetical protein [Flavivirga eckloniae]|uniref:hypothetical protein n=1 Tax=Flavivirga eckloniae TaxID=1803846 RepID=UPI0013155A25|nr:hypothetical protein [Flavivirga eckloniae]
MDKGGGPNVTFCVRTIPLNEARTKPEPGEDPNLIVAEVLLLLTNTKLDNTLQVTELTLSFWRVSNT